MRGNIGPELAPVVEMAWRTAAAGLGTEGRMGRAAKCALGAGRLSVFNRKWYHPRKGWYTKQTGLPRSCITGRFSTFFVLTAKLSMMNFTVR